MALKIYKKLGFYLEMKKIVGLAFFAVIVSTFFMLSVAVKKYQIGGFRLSKILKVENYNSFPKFSKDKQLKAILSGSYYYLGRGTQFYAFISHDKEHVIKILRSDRITTPMHKKFTASGALELTAKNKKRKEGFLKACRSAYNRLKKQTGLVYLHLKSTANLPKVDLVDNFGLHRKVDLNDFCFLIQKKAVLIKESFKSSKKQNNLEEAKRKVNSFFKLLTTRSNSGVSNSDPNLFQNFGFISDQAVELDFGDYYDNPYLLENRSTYVSEIDKHALVLRDWLLTFWPEIIPYFDEQYNLALQK